MKLLTYNINNIQFILFERILIKIQKNKYNIYINNTLNYSYNKSHFLKFIKNNYNQFYNEIYKIINNTFKGGAAVETQPTSVESADVKKNEKDEKDEETKKKTGQIINEMIEEYKTDDDDETKKNKDKEINSYYILIMKLVIILSTIIPKDIDIESYVSKIYDEIKENTGEDTVFTEAYLLRKLNNKIIEDSKDICSVESPLIDSFKKYIPEKKDIRFKNINRLIELSILLLRDKDGNNMKEIQEEIDGLKKYLIKTVEITETDDIDNLISIKYSKCNDLNITKCINNNTILGDIICELVKYRDTLKLSNVFLDNIKYKKNIHITVKDDIIKFFNIDKTIEIQSIINNIKSNIYIESKKLKLNLSEYFINYFIIVVTEHINKILQNFRFDVIYSVDYMNRQIVSLNQCISSFNTIINNTKIEKNIMSYQDIKTFEDIDEFMNNRMKENDDSFTTWESIQSFFASSFSQEQITLKVNYLNTIIKYTIKFALTKILRTNLVWKINSQVLMYYLFNFVSTYKIDKDKYGGQILNELKSSLVSEVGTFEKLINNIDKPYDSEVHKNFDITILDTVKRKKLTQIKLQKKTDEHFISTTFVSQSQNDKIYKELDELEELIFKSDILRKSKNFSDSKDDFINGVMFFYKKIDQKNNWEIKLDETKIKYYNIFINNLSRAIREHFKSKLESRFNEINIEHTNTLTELGLNDTENIDDDIELSAQLEEELSKLNNTKYKIYQEIFSELTDIINLIEKQNEYGFFQYIINKYVISQKKLPYDFSSEYEKTKIEFSKNLNDLLVLFASTRENKNIDKDLLAQHAAAKKKYEDLVEEYEKIKTISTNAELGHTSDTEKNKKTSMDTDDEQNKPPEVKSVEQTLSPKAVSVEQTLSPKAVSVKEETEEKKKTEEKKEADMLKTMAKKTPKTITRGGDLNTLEKNLEDAKKEYEELDAKLQIEKHKHSGDNNLEEFIKKISNIVEDRNTSSGNINVAISKLQLMYFVQDHNYLNLINMYSKLSDSYNKLIKLEKVNNVPKTAKPAILLLIDKLFINNLTSTAESYSDDDEEDDLDNYSNKYSESDSYEGERKYKTSNKSGNIIKTIETKLFDNLNFEKDSTQDPANSSVVLNIDTGELIT